MDVNLGSVTWGMIFNLTSPVSSLVIISPCRVDRRSEKKAMNIGVHVCLSILVSSVYMPSSGIAELYGSSNFCDFVFFFL